MSTDLATLRDQVEILRYCKEQRAKLKVLEEEAKSAIQAAMNSNELGVLDGNNVIRWSSHNRVALDSKRVKQEHPDVYLACQSVTVVRRFEIL
ncbi:Uncharacterised protein [Mycobacteroides abscessus subsp. abscessus]|nr:Uncharacterised protein [Mycobacteroides abscessus subsp. abscessus]